MAAREHRRNEWLTWHIAEGYSYFKHSPRSPVHLPELTRIDFYVLIRIRSGTDVSGHKECIDGLDMFHLANCPRFRALGPGPDQLFVDKSIADFKAWWTHHRWLEMGIPRQHPDLADVQVVAGNPFTYTITILQGDIYVDRVLGIAKDFCAFCQRSHDLSRTCMAPLYYVNSRLQFCSPENRLCGGCGAVLASNPNNHFRANPGCIGRWRKAFYVGLRDDWDAVENGLKNALAIRFLIDQFNL